MDIDADIINVLNDLVQFLEHLCDVKLPAGLENVRATLLRRSRTSLVVARRRSISPEPYLDMNAGKGKLLLLKADLANIKDHHITEYIDPDNRNAPQDYYESFQDVGTNSSKPTSHEDDIEEARKEMYRRLSAEQMMSRCAKSGPIFQKEERRLFGLQLFGGYDQFRSCWIGLVGSYLLLYTTRNDKQTSDVICVRGYSARPAPNSIPKDPTRGKSAFEIFCPGNRTFIFIARTPKEMEQWVVAFCKAGCAVSNQSESLLSVTPGETKKLECSTDSVSSQEAYQDVGPLKQDMDQHSAKNNDEAGKTELRRPENGKSPNDCAPPLPARTPRRLPSLPPEKTAVHNPIDECYDEDDIYHKIEELKEPTNYQNFMSLPKIKDSKKNDKSLSRHIEAYDEMPDTKKKGKKAKPKAKLKNHKQFSTPLDTYDDVQAADPTRSESVREDRNSITYDDVETINSNCKADGIQESPEKQRKKTFLERVRNMKDSTRKEDKKSKSKQSSPVKDAVQLAPQVCQELPTYDDVSNLATSVTDSSMDTADYTCPPAPRPIYIKSPVIECEEVYDDIGVLQAHDRSLDLAVNGNAIEPSGPVNDHQSAMTTSSSVKTCDSQFEANKVDDELEHYQVPRSQDPIDLRGQLDEATKEEELYDDIAILEDFRAKQRDSASSSISSEKIGINVSKVWNRFASERKSKIFEMPNEKIKPTHSDECIKSSPEVTEFDGLKLNKFQKLINKMEYSLNKSSKLVPSTMNNKYDDDNK